MRMAAYAENEGTSRTIAASMIRPEEGAMEYNSAAENIDPLIHGVARADETPDTAERETAEAAANDGTGERE